MPSSFSHFFSCASKCAKSAYGCEVVCYCLRNRVVLIHRVLSLNKCDNLWMKVELLWGISQSRLKVLNDGMKRSQKWYTDMPKKKKKRKKTNQRRETSKCVYPGKKLSFFFFFKEFLGISSWTFFHLIKHASTSWRIL